MSAPSESARLRERGNLYYGRAADAKHADDKLNLLNVAKGLYEKALQVASTLDGRASIHKNLGATNSQLASLSSTASSKRQLLLQTVHHRCQAFVAGRDAHKSKAWQDAVWMDIYAAIDLLLDQMTELLQTSPRNMGQVLRQLAELQAGMPEDTYAWRTYSSQVLLKAVKDVAAQLIATSSPADGDARSPADGETRSRATAPAEADWRGCLQLLAECNRPLIEALQLALDSGKNDVATDLLALEQELYVMEYRAKSTQERLQGEQQMQRTLRQRSDRLDRQATAAAVAAEEEACELDGLLTAVDRLKSAVLLARGCDAQAEAQALSSLGHLYKVSAAILNPLLVPRTAAAGAAVADTLPPRSAEERSHDAFMRVLRLFESLPNKISLVMEDWYREARDSVSEYQASKAAAEEKLKEADRAPIREALDAELEALSAAASKGWAELIKHCYSKHPPLNEANRLAPDTVFDADHGKELLKRAILAYHPDKQGASGVELSWKVLAEEITKQLTDKYEYFK